MNFELGFIGGVTLGCIAAFLVAWKANRAAKRRAAILAAREKVDPPITEPKPPAASHRTRQNYLDSKRDYQPTKGRRVSDVMEESLRERRNQASLSSPSQQPHLAQPAFINDCDGRVHHTGHVDHTPSSRISGCDTPSESRSYGGDSYSGSSDSPSGTSD